MLLLDKKMNESVFMELESTASAVDDAVRSCEHFVFGRGVVDPSSVTLVLRELLLNAVEHGNRNIVDLPVLCTIEDLGEGEFSRGFGGAQPFFRDPRPQGDLGDLRLLQEFLFAQHERHSMSRRGS